MGSHQQYLFVRPGADNYLNTSVMSAVCRMVIAEGLSVVSLLSGQSGPHHTGFHSVWLQFFQIGLVWSLL